jgi:hypothetical protein
MKVGSADRSATNYACRLSASWDGDAAGLRTIPLMDLDVEADLLLQGRDAMAAARSSECERLLSGRLPHDPKLLLEQKKGGRLNEPAPLHKRLT